MKVGEIRVKVQLENDRDAYEHRYGKIAKNKMRTAEIEAVVDTGAVMTLLPREIVRKLGLRVIDKTTVTLANEQQVELDCAGPLSLRIGNRHMITDCLVGPPGCEPLLGQLVMERLDLIPDPKNRTISPRPESPLRPTLKMK